ncbi:DUF2977 domain-containing protein [Pediococcus acidilactici]|uniref:DUF2977 domain-containing protein n=1 Tax=Pediococcus acidilactici TaxID=1254 RepID=UPI002AFEE385|nr:DUF2977 domain-containing protein [Pediococcus acidilactici]WQS11479.1 DUF2977 domain-containing protein [Pediococcus acidilactici]
MVMKIEVNDNNEIIAYVKRGDILGDNLIEIEEDKIPDGFYKNYKPSFYLLKNNEIVENPDYVASNPPEVKPSDLEKQVTMLAYQQMVDSQTIDALQQQNAKMAYQIMTGGK